MHNDAVGAGAEDRTPGDDELEVVAILRERNTSEGVHYLVHWKGWPKEAATWEPAGNLVNCALVLRQWKRNQSMYSRARATTEAHCRPRKTPQLQPSSALPSPAPRVSAMAEQWNALYMAPFEAMKSGQNDPRPISQRKPRRGGDRTVHDPRPISQRKPRRGADRTMNATGLMAASSPIESSASSMTETGTLVTIKIENDERSRSGGRRLVAKDGDADQEPAREATSQTTERGGGWTHRGSASAAAKPLSPSAKLAPRTQETADWDFDSSSDPCNQHVAPMEKKPRKGREDFYSFLASSSATGERSVLQLPGQRAVPLLLPLSGGKDCNVGCLRQEPMEWSMRAATASDTLMVASHGIAPRQAAVTSSAQFNPACIAQGCGGAGVPVIPAGRETARLLQCSSCGVSWQSSWWCRYLLSGGAFDNNAGLAQRDAGKEAEGVNSPASAAKAHRRVHGTEREEAKNETEHSKAVMYPRTYRR